jgi:hypothetical protein
LPYFQPFYSLRILLTPTERRKPWILYLTPGLLAAELLHIIYVVIGLRGLRHALLPSLYMGDDTQPQDLSFRSLVIYLAIALISTAILCPLEVISTRLAVQRNHESTEFNSVAQEEVGDAEDLPEYSPDEDVIGYDFYPGRSYFNVLLTYVNIQTEERYGPILGSRRLHKEDSQRGRLARTIPRMVADHALRSLWCFRLVGLNMFRLVCVRTHCYRSWLVPIAQHHADHVSQHRGPCTSSVSNQIFQTLPRQYLTFNDQSCLVHAKLR